MQNCIYQPHVMPCLAMRSWLQKEHKTLHLWSKDGKTIQPKCSNLTFCCEDRLAEFFKNPFYSLIDGGRRLSPASLASQIPNILPLVLSGPCLELWPTWKSRKLFNSFFLFSSFKIQKDFLNGSCIFSKLEFFLFSGCELCQLFCLNAE